MELIFRILSIIGGLGVFLFGMKLLSEALQKVAGNKMRNTLAAITSKRLRGIMTGLLITGAIQSSSAVTVMVVSFVNAGLLSLLEASGVIMGANIGTTVTAWIIALLGTGKGFSISLIGLPLVAISIPFMFSGNDRLKSWAEFLIGLAILFFGLNFMRESLPEINQDTGLIKDITEYYTNSGFTSILMFVLFGMFITVIFQSSSATMALTIVLALDGWIPFELAVAMVLGENIGTTGTALLSSIVANRPGRQAAVFHLLFNVIGVLWALLLFRPLIMSVNYLVGSIAGNDQGLSGIVIGLALFHSAFNIINTFLLAGFTPQILHLAGRIVGTSPMDKKDFRLTYFDARFLSTSELSIVQARKEIGLLGRITEKMFALVPQLLVEKNPKAYDKLLSTVKEYEDRIDSMDIEISSYITRLSEGKLSKSGSEQVRSMLQIINDLESIGDACNKMALSIHIKNQGKLYFIQDLRNNLNEIFSLTAQALEIMNENISGRYRKENFDKAVKWERRIDSCRTRLIGEHLENLKQNKYNFATGMVYSELIELSEKIGDYAINVSEAVSGEREDLSIIDDQGGDQ